MAVACPLVENVSSSWSMTDPHRARLNCFSCLGFGNKVHFLKILPNGWPQALCSPSFPQICPRCPIFLFPSSKRSLFEAEHLYAWVTGHPVDEAILPWSSWDNKNCCRIIIADRNHIITDRNNCHRGRVGLSLWISSGLSLNFSPAPFSIKIL